MSRKFDRTMRVNQQVADILQDPNTLVYIGKMLFRKKPKYIPQFLWNIPMSIVMNPATKTKTVEVERDA